MLHTILVFISRLTILGEQPFLKACGITEDKNELFVYSHMTYVLCSHLTLDVAKYLVCLLHWLPCSVDS